MFGDKNKRRTDKFRLPGFEVGRGEIVAGSFVGYDVVAYVGNVKLPELFGA